MVSLALVLGLRQLADRSFFVAILLGALYPSCVARIVGSLGIALAFHVLLVVSITIAVETAHTRGDTHTSIGSLESTLFQSVSPHAQLVAAIVFGVWALHVTVFEYLCGGDTEKAADQAARVATKFGCRRRRQHESAWGSSRYSSCDDHQQRQVSAGGFINNLGDDLFAPNNGNTVSISVGASPRSPGSSEDDDLLESDYRSQSDRDGYRRSELQNRESGEEILSEYYDEDATPSDSGESRYSRNLVVPRVRYGSFEEASDVNASDLDEVHEEVQEKGEEVSYNDLSKHSAASTKCTQDNSAIYSEDGSSASSLANNDDDAFLSESSRDVGVRPAEVVNANVRKAGAKAVPRTYWLSFVKEGICLIWFSVLVFCAALDDRSQSMLDTAMVKAFGETSFFSVTGLGALTLFGIRVVAFLTGVLLQVVLERRTVVILGIFVFLFLGVVESTTAIVGLYMSSSDASSHNQMFIQKWFVG